MGYAEDWKELMFSLQCLNKGSAKRQFRQELKYAFGGLCAYCRENRATTLDHINPNPQEAVAFDLLPCCQSCNHDKGSENWLVWINGKSFTTLLLKN